jgi:hypothetical protein
MRPRSAPCGLFALCTDEECAACPQAAVREPGEPFRDAFGPDSAGIHASVQRTDAPAQVFAQVSKPAPFAFRMRR